MPKHIKALKCPQCGSTRATQLREDHYRCDSCSTEFFLDSDDITIHHKIETVSDSSNPMTFLWNAVTANTKRSALIALGLFVFFSLMGVIGAITSKNSVRDNNHSKVRTSYGLERLAAFTSTAGRPIVMLCGSHRSMGSSGSSDETKVFVRFFDGETKKLLKKVDLPDVKGNITLTKARQFGDGKFYFILSVKRLYSVDCSTLDVKEISGADYKLPEFSEGFAEVNFYYADHGDALQIMTNMGQSFVYYPIANKLYPYKTAFYASQDELPAAKVVTHFTFSEQKSFDKEQQIQLVRYRTLEQVGYPRYTPKFGWDRDDARPYPAKIFVSREGAMLSRLQSYEDFTPGAYYFSPEVLDESADRVLISFKPRAAPDAKRIFRCLDARTGKVLWSYSDEENQFETNPDVARFSGGYLLVRYSQAWVLSNDGKLSEGTDYHKLVEGS